MASSTNNFTINGAIDTNNSLLDNINTIASAAVSWVTYDYTTGKWSVIINKIESSIKSFDDSNIIGNINVTETDLNSLYNGLTIEYPHKDLRNQTDYIDLTITGSRYFDNEMENILSLSYPIINNQVQASYVGTIELNQNRMDKVIQFTTDFTSLGLVKAGDVIDITNDMYGFTNKKFRVTKIVEVDNDDGTILINITGLEYDDSIYDYGSINYEYRTMQTGILPKITNLALTTSDNNSFLLQMGRLFGANLACALLDWLLTDDNGTLKGILKTKDGISDTALACLGKPKVTIEGLDEVYEGDTASYTLSAPDYGCGTFDLPYTITGTNPATHTSTPLSGNITFTNGQATFDIVTLADADSIDDTITLNINCVSKSLLIKERTAGAALTADKTTVSECEDLTFTLNVIGSPADTYPYTITGITAADLATGSLTGNFTMAGSSTDKTGTVTLTFTKGTVEGSENIIMNVNNGMATLTIPLTDGAGYSVTASPSTIKRGQSTAVTVTVTSTNGTESVPYEITGSDTDIITSPALTGEVTLSGGTATLNIQTTNNGSTSGGNISVKFGPIPNFGICYGTANITIDASTATITCQTVTIPLTWCAYYDSGDGKPYNLYAKSYAVCFADSSGTTVPTGASLNSSGTGVITVSSTTKVSSNSNRGGIPIQVITGFNTVSPNSPVTGTTTTVYAIGFSNY